MQTTLVSEDTPKSRKRTPVRTNPRASVQKTKITLVLDEDTAKRLAVFAAMTAQERSHVVAQLINDHLRRFRVQDLSQSDKARCADPGTELVSAS